MHDSFASSPVPHIATGLPGPRAAAIVADDDRWLSPSYTWAYPLVVERAQGVVVEDVDGNRFLDFTAGIAVCSTGHCHPRVVAAVERQSARLLHMSGTDFHYALQTELAKQLAQLAPGDEPKRVFFSNSGAEAVEAAFKLARFHTGRHRIIAFHGGFHGRTFGALSLTGSKIAQRRGFAPLVPGVTHVDFANPYRGRDVRCTDDCIEHIEQTVFRHVVPPDEVAAIIVEPIQGEGGYIVPPDDFHLRLKELAARHGILLIADEVQSGMGRTGRMFAMEHWNVVPDIVCLAKGIASGLPLGATIASANVMNWPRGSHASTFGGNPVSCAAALETIALLQEELIENAASVGEFLLHRLNDLRERHPLIGDVRGRGLMIGAELVRDRQTKESAVDDRDAVVDACFRRGLLLLGCGESTLRFSPPLVVTKEQAEIAVNILDDVLARR
ncbi:MAG: acetyl ornithine aminotransferase family protein [Planctomycetaceae bacterium]